MSAERNDWVLTVDEILGERRAIRALPGMLRKNSDLPRLRPDIGAAFATGSPGEPVDWSRDGATYLHRVDDTVSVTFTPPSGKFVHRSEYNWPTTARRNVDNSPHLRQDPALRRRFHEILDETNRPDQQQSMKPQYAAVMYKMMWLMRQHNLAESYLYFHTKFQFDRFPAEVHGLPAPGPTPSVASAARTRTAVVTRPQPFDGRRRGPSALTDEYRTALGLSTFPGATKPRTERSPGRAR
ncbi:hypothetical protein [Jidongwangia harbinensis]|uniref:hypothetical protein n=1 Tax=Jidongwangia harbinensis TaxID=2878561 RepID=UPI001CDA085C|nr:hypothetical protein [Jidongwangia harbinensis]MCA2217414.1 hypothetical protein [Jidongwangia harbinensis]